MSKYSTENVKLYDERTVPLEPMLAERVNHLLGNTPDTAKEEVMKLLMCVTGGQGSWLELTSRQWVQRFNTSLSRLLKASELHLMEGGGKSLYQELYVKDEKERGRG